MQTHRKHCKWIFVEEPHNLHVQQRSKKIKFTKILNQAEVDNCPRQLMKIKDQQHNPLPATPTQIAKQDLETVMQQRFAMNTKFQYLPSLLVNATMLHVFMETKASWSCQLSELYFCQGPLKIQHRACVSPQG